MCSSEMFSPPNGPVIPPFGSYDGLLLHRGRCNVARDHTPLGIRGTQTRIEVQIGPPQREAKAEAR
jgi:hypothetical protein